MWTTEFVQLNSDITIVVELKFGLPKSRFISLCDTIVGHVCTFATVEETDKNKIR